MVITPEDVAQWRNNPVTKKFRDMLLSDKRSIESQWSSGAYTGDVELVMRGKAMLISEVVEGIDEIGKRLAESGEEVE